MHRLPFENYAVDAAKSLLSEQINKASPADLRIMWCEKPEPSEGS